MPVGVPPAIDESPSPERNHQHVSVSLGDMSGGTAEMSATSATMTIPEEEIEVRSPLRTGPAAGPPVLAVRPPDNRAGVPLNDSRLSLVRSDPEPFSSDVQIPEAEVDLKTYDDRVGEHPCPCLDFEFMPVITARGYLYMNIGFGCPISGGICGLIGWLTYKNADMNQMSVYGQEFVQDIMISCFMQAMCTYIISSALGLNDFKKGYMAVLRLDMSSLQEIDISGGFEGSLFHMKPLCSPEFPPPLKETDFGKRILWQLWRGILVGLVVGMPFAGIFYLCVMGVQDGKQGPWTPGQLFWVKFLLGFLLALPCLWLTVYYMTVSAAFYEREASDMIQQHPKGASARSPVCPLQEVFPRRRSRLGSCTSPAAVTSPVTELEGASPD